MKRFFIVSTLCLITFLTGLRCGTDKIINCPNVSGDYAITKTVTGFNATKAGASVNIEDQSAVLPNQSSLSITQTGCPLVAIETISSSNNLEIPYSGTADSSGGFQLKISNPDAIAIPLQIKIPGEESKTCNFNGSINWDGKESNGSLSGTIKYDLKKRSDETKTLCPDSATVDMSFTGSRK